MPAPTIVNGICFPGCRHVIRAVISERVVVGPRLPRNEQDGRRREDCQPAAVLRRASLPIRRVAHAQSPSSAVGDASAQDQPRRQQHQRAWPGHRGDAGGVDTGRGRLRRAWDRRSTFRQLPPPTHLHWQAAASAANVVRRSRRWCRRCSVGARQNQFPAGHGELGRLRSTAR